MSISDKIYYQDEWATIYCGDCREILPELPDKSIDLVLTDPPYPQEYIECFSVLSLNAKRMLKDGAPLLCYSGQLHLLEVMQRLSEYLSYRWVIALLHTESQIVWGARMIAGWKPILLYQNGTTQEPLKIRRDIVGGYKKQKQFHKWQQSDRDIGGLIQDYTTENDLILDPFLCSGTTAFVAKKLNRRSIGIEINEKYCEIAKKRLSQSVMVL